MRNVHKLKGMITHLANVSYVRDRIDQNNSFWRAVLKLDNTIKGRTNSSSGPHAARGPRVGHPWLSSFWSHLQHRRWRKYATLYYVTTGQNFGLLTKDTNTMISIN